MNAEEFDQEFSTGEPVENIDEKDLRVDVFSNIIESIVRVTHTPTGISGTGHDKGDYFGQPSSQLKAKALAMQELLAKLDGTRASVVCLLTGISRERLEELGGVDET